MNTFQEFVKCNNLPYPIESELDWKLYSKTPELSDEEDFVLENVQNLDLLLFVEHQCWMSDAVLDAITERFIASELDNFYVRKFWKNLCSKNLFSEAFIRKYEKQLRVNAYQLLVNEDWSDSFIDEFAEFFIKRSNYISLDFVRRHEKLIDFNLAISNMKLKLSLDYREELYLKGLIDLPTLVKFTKLSDEFIEKYVLEDEESYSILPSSQAISTSLIERHLSERPEDLYFFLLRFSIPFELYKKYGRDFDTIYLGTQFGFSEEFILEHFPEEENVRWHNVSEAYLEKILPSIRNPYQYDLSERLIKKYLVSEKYKDIVDFCLDPYDSVVFFNCSTDLIEYIYDNIIPKEYIDIPSGRHFYTIPTSVWAQDYFLKLACYFNPIVLEESHGEDFKKRVREILKDLPHFHRSLTTPMLFTFETVGEYYIGYIPTDLFDKYLSFFLKEGMSIRFTKANPNPNSTFVLGGIVYDSPYNAIKKSHSITEVFKVHFKISDVGNCKVEEGAVEVSGFEVIERVELDFLNL